MLLNKKWRLTKNQRGMTLIELMAVVVILGILATIAGVAVVNASEKAKVSADTSTISILKDAAQRYILDKDVDVPKQSATTPTPLLLTSDALLNGLYIREIPKDSEGKTFKELTLILDDVATPNKMVWTFKNTESTPGEFAPKATNK